MIGLDTNVVVRYLTQDDPQQSRRASQIFDQQLTSAEPGFLSVVTMVETVWVLDRAYRFSGREIAAAVELLLQTDVLVMENEQEVFTAMTVLKEKQGDFTDAMIAALGAKAGCQHTVTFDQKALRLPGFRLA
jgi:predicted nucleic-acid-binding protein